MKTIKLTISENKVLKEFKKFKACPSNEFLAFNLGHSNEYVRKIMWRLVAKKLVKVNKKLKNNKFYV